jgi:hypothetical protein
MAVSTGAPPRPRSGLLANLALGLASLALCLVLLEHVVFRFVLVPDDVLPNVTINQVVRYAPGTVATFRHPDGSSTRATINEDGWNSARRAYPLARTPGRMRIAVIGDSYVHGGFVDVEEAFPEVLERMLADAGREVEVFRFGMDGAPLSQYLHVLRREVRAFAPDLVIVPLIHNDFDESYRRLKTRYASSFMKLEADQRGRIAEVAPADFRPGAADVLRNFRTFRYLYYETNAYLHLKGLVSRLFWGGSEEWAPEFVSSAVDIRKIADHDQNRLFARYVLERMKKEAAEGGFGLLFVMDAVREAIYEGRPAGAYEVGRLNRIAADLTGELALPFIDLQEAFARDYAARGRRFEFDYDWHWNAHANRIVAQTLADAVLAGAAEPRTAR